MNNNDRMNLIRRISELEGLTDKERSALLGLLRESKSYGLVWEDKPEGGGEDARRTTRIEGSAGACHHQRCPRCAQSYYD